MTLQNKVTGLVDYAQKISAAFKACVFDDASAQEFRDLFRDGLHLSHITLSSEGLISETVADLRNKLTTVQAKKKERRPQAGGTYEAVKGFASNVLGYLSAPAESAVQDATANAAIAKEQNRRAERFITKSLEYRDLLTSCMQDLLAVLKVSGHSTTAPSCEIDELFEHLACLEKEIQQEVGMAALTSGFNRSSLRINELVEAESTAAAFAPPPPPPPMPMLSTTASASNGRADLFAQIQNTGQAALKRREPTADIVQTDASESNHGTALEAAVAARAQGKGLTSASNRQMKEAPKPPLTFLDQLIQPPAEREVFMYKKPATKKAAPVSAAKGSLFDTINARLNAEKAAQDAEKARKKSLRKAVADSDDEQQSASDSDSWSDNESSTETKTSPPATSQVTPQTTFGKERPSVAPKPKPVGAVGTAAPALK